MGDQQGGGGMSENQEPAAAMSVTLTGCTVSGVRADLLKGRVKVTFDAALDDQMLEAKRILSWLAVDESAVDLEITEATNETTSQGERAHGLGWVMSDNALISDLDVLKRVSEQLASWSLDGCLEYSNLTNHEVAELERLEFLVEEAIIKADAQWLK